MYKQNFAHLCELPWEHEGHHGGHSGCDTEPVLVHSRHGIKGSRVLQIRHALADPYSTQGPLVGHLMYLTYFFSLIIKMY